MSRPAYVYNCRSSNVWDLDLALTVTFFPENGLSFAVLFGCPYAKEKEVIKLLSNIREEAAHPLLMPGIFSELENSRHVRLVDSAINEVQQQTFELDNIAERPDEDDMTQSAERIKQKRKAWLDLTYLRNSIVTWDKQLTKMVDHSRFLIENVFVSDGAQQSLEAHGKLLTNSHTGRKLEFCQKMCDTGRRIQDRILSIKDEYDEKLRDCQMRLDGMSMTTQWSHGETNLQVALATNRDSRHMRSIALVTMIFLPGTFFASMFSMTFFDWSGGTDGTPLVSTNIWIYIVLTILSTSFTVAVWYYIAVFRYRYRKEKDVESG